MMTNIRSHKWRIQNPTMRLAVVIGSAVALVATVGAPTKWW
jgi:hypothetical protein